MTSKRRRRTSARSSPSEDEQGSDGVPIAPSEDEARTILETAEVLRGWRIARGSNYTFLLHLAAGPGKYVRAVYKPRDGERPLWDFDHGTLYKREYAAFVLARALGWPDVPLTLVREDGPYGVGSMQLFVECDPRVSYFDLTDDHTATLQRFAVFDAVANNADRKAGHCLLGYDGRIWSIDHGLTFHHHFKVRTVMLEMWGLEIPDEDLETLSDIAGQLVKGTGVGAELADSVSPEEIDAMVERIGILLDQGALPRLDPYSHVPWPFV